MAARTGRIDPVLGQAFAHGQRFQHVFSFKLGTLGGGGGGGLPRRFPRIQLPTNDGDVRVA